MKLEKSTDKLDEYFGRLKKGKAKEIKPSHVEKVIKKLNSKEKSLLDEIEDTKKDSKVKRLKSKLKLLREQQERAQWLLKKITDPSKKAD